ncbi:MULTISPECIES: CheB methylesterase domain-containing protein [unclassified Nitratiruptor]|uniref:CheB methylesterase domain-containing protein n=1 Tax=unclassified Nitratiruptor TaxID=2624044 RepID=UPI001915F011|nr:MULTISPECIES: CheB methylesterase domain-containing protein [unclassified Nitratiruptor]BCD60417.1 two-component system, chemotaxis family, protein-glutamate methylesterase/glutaminase [Nitratiruptor sp. YY08-10]BCD64094.1 two-component system, chemotaxis family, protein-glutamate methylesterase/glutaminase [Nitratiruptor sp. YY08-14]
MTPHKCVLIGASTGGPELIEKIAKILPKKYPFPVCVVVHFPLHFSASFAKRLNEHSAIQVLEAVEGMKLQSGTMYIAKSGQHMCFEKNKDAIVIRLQDKRENEVFIPSVDEMFLSAKNVFDPENILAVLLTGIGNDGASGMVELKKAGAVTIAQDEKSSTVYGMPKEAYLRGGVMKVLPFDGIMHEILRYGEKM